MNENLRIASVSQWSEPLEPALIDFRRELHQNPELSFAEYQTTERIMQALRDAGLQPVKMDETGA